MSAEAKIAARTPRRVIEVNVPEWSSDPTSMIEPSVRDYIAASKANSDQDRAVMLLGACVLDATGNPVGPDAILAAPITAFAALSAYLPTLLGQQEAENAPLDKTSSSSIG